MKEAIQEQMEKTKYKRKQVKEKTIKEAIQEQMENTKYKRKQVRRKQ